MAVKAQSDQIPGPQRHVGVEEIFLGHVGDRSQAIPSLRAIDRDTTGICFLETENRA